MNLQTDTDWQPHVTVATVVEDNGHYLLVEEFRDGKLVYNQPAGHLDPNESLAEAAVRETLEETGWHIDLQGLVGLALYYAPQNQTTYHRTTFYAQAIRHDPELTLDDGIERAVWMSYEDMLNAADKMRSKLVIQAVEQYRNNHKYPLSMIYN
jgi:8-oxo-dGTP pyrophosphatase MutT (NUDIX family)